jgi:hypothetical protein
MKRHLRKLIAAAALLAAFAAGTFVRIEIQAPRARAAYHVTGSDPEVTFDLTAFEQSAATFMKAQGITTNAQRATAVGNITAGSAAELAAVKALLNSLILVP